MATGRSTKLTGATGEYLVAAELCRRDLIATPFSGNVPHYDIVASDDKGGHLVVQVKAINAGSWQFDASKFFEIKINGNRQELGGLAKEPHPNLFCVFLLLGKSYREDRYFIFSWKELQKVIFNHYSEYLKSHDNIRPKNPKSKHCSLSVADLGQYENLWQKIEAAMIRTRNAGQGGPADGFAAAYL